MYLRYGSEKKVRVSDCIVICSLCINFFTVISEMVKYY